MSHDDRQALLKTDEEWAQAARQATDADRIASFWAADARVFPPGKKVLVGRPAIRAFVESSLKEPGFAVDWQPREAVVSPDAHFGYTTGPIQFTGADDSGKVNTSRYRYVCVWRKEADGTWKCIVDIWNNEPDQPR